MQEIDPKVIEALNKSDGTEKLNVDKLVKFGVLEKESEPIKGWKITMHPLAQDEQEQMSKYLTEDVNMTMYTRSVMLKRPTLMWAITKINDEVFETEEQKKSLNDQLKKTPSTTIDLLYLEYQKLYVEQFELLSTGIKKK
jgi:hypothetical protein